MKDNEAQSKTTRPFWHYLRKAGRANYVTEPPRCSSCYGDIRGECIRIGRCVAAASAQERLDADMRRSLWALYDAAKVISYHPSDATPDQWCAFYRAVANVPESQHGR